MPCRLKNLQQVESCKLWELFGVNRDVWKKDMISARQILGNKYAFAVEKVLCAEMIESFSGQEPSNSKGNGNGKLCSRIGVSPSEVYDARSERKYKWNIYQTNWVFVSQMKRFWNWRFGERCKDYVKWHWTWRNSKRNIICSAFQAQCSRSRLQKGTRTTYLVGGAKCLV